MHTMKFMNNLEIVVFISILRVILQEQKDNTIVFKKSNKTPHIYTFIKKFVVVVLVV